MKKSTFLALAAVAFSSFTANAELQDKYFFKVPTDNPDMWTLQDAGRMTLSGTKDVLSVTLTNNGGRMINGFWNEDAWVKVPDLSVLPENTYKFSYDMKMTVNSTRSDMEFVLLPVGACSSSDSRVSSHNYHWFNAQDAEGADGSVVEDYFFRYRVYRSSAEQVSVVINENPIARNDWPVVTEASDTLDLAVGVKYTFATVINTVAKTATYTISSEDGATVHTGVHNYVCAEDRAGIWVMSANSGNSTMELSNMGLSYLAEGPFAAEPSAALFWVEGAERDYFVQFSEGDVLHWIQLGDAEDVVSGETYAAGEEYTIAWGDAMDTKDFEAGEDMGCKIITCTESGTLKLWCSRADDETNTSDDVLVEVVCEALTLPAPVAAITNVSEGYGKEYTLTVDNSQVLLKPTITIHYTLTEGGNVKEGDVLSGEKVNFTGAGTLSLYACDKTHKTPCYAQSEVVSVENNVEYTVAVDNNFQYDYETINAGKEGFHIVEIVDAGGKSHWDRIMSTETRGYKEDGSNEVYNADNADSYAWVKSGHNIYADTACGTEEARWNNLVADDPYKIALPLIPAEEDPETYKVLNDKSEYAWAIFPYEGVVYYDVNTTADNGVCAVKKNDAGAAGYVEMKLEERFVSDDANKPNFVIVGTTGGYNRPDKGDCSATTVLVAGEKFWLYRYDTAIRFVKVMTYKGFVAAIDAIESDVKSEAAPIFNLRGEKVQNMAAPGFYIQNGRVKMVK